MIAQIAISSAVFAMDKPYDYLVPPQMQTQLQPGMRVMVPFGRANPASGGNGAGPGHDGETGAEKH